MPQFDCFFTPNALAINQSRQQHLASLGLPIQQKSVLEVGAGIGLHTQFFLDRSCQMTVSDGREDNLEEIRRLHPGLSSHLVDLDQGTDLAYLGQFDIIYCYGLLYHLGDPESAIRRMAEICRGQIFLELICSTDTEVRLHLCSDPGGNDQSTVGQGCRPSRSWILEKLRRYFGHGYITTTQPDHPEFPLDWDHPTHGNTRAVFIGSKQALHNPKLAEQPSQLQTKCAII